MRGPVASPHGLCRPGGRRKGCLMADNSLKCCGRFMLRVTGENPCWGCPECGTRRNREGEIVTPGGTSGTDRSAGYRSDGHDVSRSDGQGAVTGDASPDEPFTGRGDGEKTNSNPTGPAHVTDYQPRCWKCGRMLGKYFSRPWSIKCRRCKATNQEH